MNSLPSTDPLFQQTLSVFNSNRLEGFSHWKKTKYSFIAPADTEYTYQWLWDTAFHSIVLSHIDTELAKNEIRNFLLGQWDNGFLPHVIFWGSKKVLPVWAYIESALAFRPHTTALTQPPALALAVEIIYNRDKDIGFLKEVLPKLARHHRWLIENRDNDRDFLLSIISPNESGMDELPVFQYVMGYHGNNAAKLHYYYRKADFLNHAYRYNCKTILVKDYFNVEELLFNTVFIEANRSLSRLFHVIGHPDTAGLFSDLAEKSEESLLEKCWDEHDKNFYSIFSAHEKKARVNTIASLLPLFLEGLGGNKLDYLINNHLLNPGEYWLPYPIPSVAKNERYYEPADIPARRGKLIWRGPTWVNTNWFIVKGLRKHGFHTIADNIVNSMKQMIQKWGFREYYNPETGEGYRRENFGWSTLLIDLLEEQSQSKPVSPRTDNIEYQSENNHQYENI